MTVVPVMNGHAWDQAKVSLHDSWPLVSAMSGLVWSQTHYPTRDIHTEYMHRHINYAIISEPIINAL